MTAVSIVAGGLAALCCGLLGGRCLRNFRAGSAMALALAVAVGLLMLQTSKGSDLLRGLQPKVASDWLPLFAILAASCMLIQPTSYRVGYGILLAILMPVRLLWGSIYLPSETIDLAVLLRITVWSAALAVAVLLTNDQPARLISWKTAVWGIAVAGTAALITLSGSLTYGVATGVCGLATLSVLIATSRIPNIAAVPVICLIGLSASFSELLLSTAGLLLLAWIGVLIADRMTAHSIVGVVRGGAVSVLLLAGIMMFVRFTGSHEIVETPNMGYGSFDSMNPFDGLDTE